MNFFQLLKSLDDLLFEVISWLAFYPRTLWHSFRSPLAMMEYARSQLSETPERRFDAHLSPPILLLLTVLLMHGIELVTIGQSQLLSQNTGIAGTITDNTSLILFRLLAVAICPLIFALRHLAARQTPLTRATLEPAFFAQGYATAPHLLLVSIGVSLGQLPSRGFVQLGTALALGGIAGLLIVETLSFRSVGLTLTRSVLNAIGGLIALIASLVAIGLATTS